jgi:soluble lytic murein transglycosylase
VSSTTGAHARSRSAAARARRQAVVARRRRLAAIGTAILVVVGLVVVFAPTVHHAVDELTLPLRHEDIIRQQAAAKRLDPALVAAVINTESRFRDRTSSAGARGLMQITPDTAQFIEKISGGRTFTLSDLADPQINISYGTYYLRYLIDRFGSERLALAAYNAGAGNVERWLEEARAKGRALQLDDIPFAETRAYVQSVESFKTRYRHTYAHQLGY